MRHELTPMNPSHVPCNMVDGTRLKILAHLSKFRDNYDHKWDVPREQSLPGIAEALGVVRSALHKPLTSLENKKLVTSRNAKVSDQGSRRRKVIHITELGLNIISDIGIPSQIKKYRIFGPLPKLTTVHGRNEEITNIYNLLNQGRNVLLNGLPGIGKSSLARNIAEVMMLKDWTLRWATCYNDTDVSAIANMWLKQSGMSSPTAISAAVDSSKNLLVIDEIQELNIRHINSINNLILEISKTQASILLLVRAPSPFDNLIEFENIRINGLHLDDAKKILPQDLPDSSVIKIIESLGGHPLALHLWDSDTKLPEENDAVQEFVESTVIKRLSNDGLRTLDELSITPIPLGVKEIFSSKGTDELDDYAILKNHGNELEIHHLIRNVRRRYFTEKEVQDFHHEMAIKWAKRNGIRATRMEVHHRLESGKVIDSKWLLSHLSELLSKDSASAAIIFEQAISNNDEEILREAASDIAIERGEIEIANLHINCLSNGINKTKRLVRLARIRGNAKLAEELDFELSKNLNPVEKIKNEISTLVRIHDDRLPGPINNNLLKKIKHKISIIDISALPDNKRNVASLSLNLIQNSIALETQDMTSAAASRSLLESQLGYDNPKLKIIDLKSRLAIRKNGNASKESIEAARNEIRKCDNILDKLILIHMTLDASGPKYPQWLIQSHSEITEKPLREDIAAHRRVIAHKWYWRGILEPERKLSHWRESLSKFRSAECINAANDLLKLISLLV